MAADHPQTLGEPIAPRWHRGAVRAFVGGGLWLSLRTANEPASVARWRSF